MLALFSEWLRNRLFEVDFKSSHRRLCAELFAQQGKGNIEHRDAGGSFAFRRPAMRMAMKGSRHAVAVERFF
jgi:hypothetical protein